MLRHMPIEVEGLPMNMERKASVFRNGRSQAIRIPKEFELACKEVTIRKEGQVLVVEPAKVKRTLAEILASLEPLAEEDRMPFIEDYPPEPVDL